MPPKIVIMFPDHYGHGFQRQFGKDLLQKFGSVAKIVPIINSEDPSLLNKETEKARASGIIPITANNTFGLRSVLQKGYKHISSIYPKAIVVRLDTEDHPLEEIDYLVHDAIVVRGMSVGCLTLSPKAATPGSMEDFVNADLFPALFRQFTDGKLTLTGASGFKAFAPSVCGKILPGAIKIMEKAGQISSPLHLRYGFDFAMILSAFHQNIPIHIKYIPTDLPEKKPRLRIIKQFGCALYLCRAAEKIKWNLR